MEDFNRICLDCGLVPNESKNTMFNNEASYFDLVHPLSEEPINEPGTDHTLIDATPEAM